MNMKVMFIWLLLSFYQKSYSQYNPKKFKEGYVIHSEDTAKCKIFTGSSVNKYEQVVFKYSDDKFEEPISYYAGSIITGYGIKTDSTFNHFWAFPMLKKAMFKKKQEVVYGQVEVSGYLKLLEYVEEKYSPGTMKPTGGFYSGSTSAHTSFYLYKTGGDSAYNIVGEKAFILSGIDEEVLINYFSDCNEIVSKIKAKIKVRLSDVIEYVKEYNIWYEETQKKKQ